jgi:hypothetical protein
MHPPVTDYFIGVDLGQRRDHSAIAVLALHRESSGTRDPVTWNWHVRTILTLGHLERLPLGTPYLKIPGLIRDLVQKLKGRHPLPTPPRIHVVIDAAGPGAPLVELIRQNHIGATLYPVLITGGERSLRQQGGWYTVPRRELISLVRILLENRALRLASRLYWTRHLEEELVSIRFDGRQTAHDDLVIAVALAAWRARSAHHDLTRFNTSSLHPALEQH